MGKKRQKAADVLTKEHKVAPKNIDAGDEEAEVTDQDLHDPTYLSLLNNLGWQDDEKANVPSASFQGKNNVSHLSESLTKEATTGVSQPNDKHLSCEGKAGTEEADAEFELAKAIESQLEEVSSQDTMKSSDPTAESAEDVSVEDFLDPQLFSALKAIGIADTTIVSCGPERQETRKPITGNTDKAGTIASQILERPEEPKLSEARVSDESS
ncbi:hypothetical protein HAX54_015612 [Datura stramonium]|uniref:Uncharacterized protein n=1 Tax=Datura stramonium TaxID=4076 RepID=A0ABS8RG37_DATST|nr:hypothetical protein [Datura stramonium]